MNPSYASTVTVFLSKEMETTIVKASVTTPESGGQIHMVIDITQETPEKPPRTFRQEHILPSICGEAGVHHPCGSTLQHNKTWLAPPGCAGYRTSGTLDAYKCNTESSILISLSLLLIACADCISLKCVYFYLLIFKPCPDQTSVWVPDDETMTETDTVMELEEQGETTTIMEPSLTPVFTPTVEKTLRHIFLSKTVRTNGLVDQHPLNTDCNTIGTDWKGDVMCFHLL